MPDYFGDTTPPHPLDAAEGPPDAVAVPHDEHVRALARQAADAAREHAQTRAEAEACDDTTAALSGALEGARATNARLLHALREAEQRAAAAEQVCEELAGEGAAERSALAGRAAALATELAGARSDAAAANTAAAAAAAESDALARGFAGERRGLLAALEKSEAAAEEGLVAMQRAADEAARGSACHGEVGVLREQLADCAEQHEVDEARCARTGASLSRVTRLYAAALEAAAEERAGYEARLSAMAAELALGAEDMPPLMRSDGGGGGGGVGFLGGAERACWGRTMPDMLGWETF